jgi:Ca2+-transporting ATPase
VSINLPLPFTTIQILWANIFADIPPALSLGLEPPEADLMDRKPRDIKQNVLTTSSITVIICQSLVMTLITFVVYYLAVEHGYFNAEIDIKQRSLAFVLLCSMQLVQSFLSRSILTSVFKVGFFGNKFLVGAFILSYGLLVLGLEIPVVASWLGLTDPGLIGWAVIAVCIVCQVVLVELVKFCCRIVFKDEVAQPMVERGAFTMVKIQSKDTLDIVA